MPHETGLENCTIRKKNQSLRMGYTTGTCAAAATKAAVRMLLGKELIYEIGLLTPKGILLTLEVLDIQNEEGAVSCAIRKDAGDDPDSTNGILIYSRVEKTKKQGITLIAGKGIGIVTLPGLSQKVGEPAINPVPRRMIRQAAEEMAELFGYEGGLLVTISAPEGEEIAKKTFNSRLGVEGGISILGTTGIVEPMSEKAYLESLRLEIAQRCLRGDRCLLMTPGNYGANYLRVYTALPAHSLIKCGNYIGAAIDYAIEQKAEGLLFVSHIGKFVKVAGGIMNTHSHEGDCRMELLSAGAIRAGSSLECAREILNCATTEEAVRILAQRELLQPVMKVLTERIQYYLEHRSYEQILTGAVIFSNEYGFLGQTASAKALINMLSGS